MNDYYFEVTDTYGGQANYCWVDRYKITARTLRGALIKLSRHTGWHFRKTYDDRYDAVKCAVCAFSVDDEYSIDTQNWRAV